MTRDQAIDKVLIELGAKPLMIRLLLSTPARDPDAQIEPQHDPHAVSIFALAGRIVDALPLLLLDSLTPAQKTWLAEHDEFELITKSYPEVALARYGFLHPGGGYESAAWGYLQEFFGNESTNRRPAPVPVGIPCMATAT